MITNTIKEIKATRAKLAALEKSANDELKKELISLPAKYGFESAKAFAKAFKAANDGSRTGRGRAGKRRRATITDETRTGVKRMVGEEKKGAEIAKALGISLPSVQKIKRGLGLVRKRKK